MATGRNSILSDRKIVQLAPAIAAKDMKTIAEGYLDIAPETVKNIDDEKRGDAEAFNREIIRYWRNRNPGRDQVKVITARKRSCGKVMFLQVSVILFTGGCLVPGGSTPGGCLVSGGESGPGGVRSRDGDPPGRLLLQVVWILLECILVLPFSCQRVCKQYIVLNHVFPVTEELFDGIV